MDKTDKDADETLTWKVVSCKFMPSEILLYGILIIGSIILPIGLSIQGEALNLWVFLAVFCGTIFVVVLKVAITHRSAGRMTRPQKLTFIKERRRFFSELSNEDY